MRHLLLGILVVAVASLKLVAAQPPGDAPVVERLDPALDGILSVDARLDVIKQDFFGAAEGPTWVSETGGGYLAFSDMGANRIYKWDPVNRHLSVLHAGAGYTGTDLTRVRALDNGRLMVALLGTNGLDVDLDGRLVFCAHGDRALGRMEVDGTRTILADRFEGKRFNGPNDLVVKSDGSIYFTDLGAPLLGGFANSPDRELDFRGVFRWRSDGAVQLISRDLGNGIAFSSFGLFVDPLESEFNWARAEVTLGFSVSMAVSGISAPMIGRLIDRVGPRRVILIGTPLTAGSYLLLATTGALWQWYVFLAINAVVRQMIFYIPFQVLVARWFHRRRTTAVSILGAGLWLGAVVMVPVIRVVIDAVEWDGAFVFSGVLIAVLFLPIALFIVRDQPPADAEEIQPLPDSDVNARDPDGRADLTVGEAIRTPIFWVITLAMMTFFYAVVGWMVHAIPYYELVGISPGLAAALVAATSAAGIVALLIFGTVVGRLGRVERSGILFGGCLTLSMVILLLGESGAVVLTLFIVFFVNPIVVVTDLIPVAPRFED